MIGAAGWTDAQCDERSPPGPSRQGSSRRSNMFQVSSSNLAWRQGATAIALIGAVALGLTVRTALPAEPLGQADDYGTRHASAASVVELSEIDDYGTRLIAKS